MFRKIIMLGLLLTLLIMPAGCGVRGQAASNEIVIAQGVDATTLDPHMHNEVTTSNITGQIFDRLLTRDAAMQLQPELALSVEPLSDLVWEVKLREGVKFHNGEDFDAASVKCSIERIIAPDSKSPQAPGLSFIADVTIIDRSTVRITTRMPYPLLPERLVLPMVPPGYLEEVGATAFAANPVGTGPYKFVSWVRDEAVILEANPDYWKAAPEIKKVTFRPIPENITRMAELQTGAVDLAVNVPPHLVSTLATGTKTKIAQTPSGRLIFVQLVTDRGGPLADRRVRQALNYALDVPAIVASVLGGNGYPSTQPLTSQDFGYNEELEGYSYDPDRARLLLADAGYPEGLEITIDAPAGRYAMDKEVAEAVAGQLAQVGVIVNLNLNEWGVHVQKILERKMEGGYLIGWGSSLFDADATLYPNFRSGERLSFYHNPAVDLLLDQARATLDRGLRQDLYHQALKYLTEDAPVFLLYQQEDIYGLSRSLIWEPRPDEAIFVYDMELQH